MIYYVLFGCLVVSVAVLRSDRFWHSWNTAAVCPHCAAPHISRFCRPGDFYWCDQCRGVSRFGWFVRLIPVDRLHLPPQP